MPSLTLMPGTQTGTAHHGDESLVLCAAQAPRSRRRRRRPPGGGAREELGADAVASPGRRNLDGELREPGVSREGRDSDDVAPDPGDHATHSLVVLAPVRRRTPPVGRRRPRPVRSGRQPGVLRGAPLLRVRPEQLLEQSAGSSAGSATTSWAAVEPARRLVDQVVSGGGFDAHLVPACTTHELGDRPAVQSWGALITSSSVTRPRSGKICRPDDVQARVSAAGGEQRQCSRAFGQRHPHPEEHGATFVPPVLRDRCAPVSGVSTNPHQARRATHPRLVVEWWPWMSVDEPP